MNEVATKAERVASINEKLKGQNMLSCRVSVTKFLDVVVPCDSPETGGGKRQALEAATAEFEAKTGIEFNRNQDAVDGVFSIDGEAGSSFRVSGGPLVFGDKVEEKMEVAIDYFD